MKMNPNSQNRRSFIRQAAAISAGVAGITALVPPTLAQPFAKEPSLLMIGPMEGYSPQIGTLVSMLNYNRSTVLGITKGLSMEQLDFLLDEHANSIGALLMHLGATEVFYRGNTFEGHQDMTDAEKEIWGAAMNLGDEGRTKIKGKELSYYVDMITEVREKTLSDLKNKDDDWLMAIDPEWSKEQDINTYWKWFHVCEHESNHRGQIAFLKSRLPGAKPESGR